MTVRLANLATWIVGTLIVIYSEGDGDCCYQQDYVLEALKIDGF
jgi:hypothetical protein